MAKYDEFCESIIHYEIIKMSIIKYVVYHDYAVR